MCSTRERKSENGLGALNINSNERKTHLWELEFIERNLRSLKVSEEAQFLRHEEEQCATLRIQTSRSSAHAVDILLQSEQATRGEREEPGKKEEGLEERKSGRGVTESGSCKP